MPDRLSKTTAVALPRVRTPCIGVCSTGIGDAVCRGCKRFQHEVIDWNAYSEDEKRIVDRRLAGFLSQSVANHLEIVDKSLLKWQLDVQQVRHNDQHDEYCWLFALLKAGASQITDTEQFGFRRRPDTAQMDLIAIREEIDRAFWVLSVAHYERYMATADLFVAQESATHG
ncbi:MAG: DUF1289 domain-containing protein [Halieaceae bacterium]|jgi:predicted Fe-S protein YdhL (DUF1289 family)|nr:DUF1289 domain-containing protein [Halieaceae bacterium]